MIFERSLRIRINQVTHEVQHQRFKVAVYLMYELINGITTVIEREKEHFFEDCIDSYPFSGKMFLFYIYKSTIHKRFKLHRNGFGKNITNFR